MHNGASLAVTSSFKNSNGEGHKVRQSQTRWVLSETKAIMSPPPVCHWMEAIFFVEEGELIN